MHYQWIHQQFSNVNMKDARLQKRAVQIAQGCAEHPDKSFLRTMCEHMVEKIGYRGPKNVQMEKRL